MQCYSVVCLNQALLRWTRRKVQHKQELSYRKQIARRGQPRDLEI